MVSSYMRLTPNGRTSRVCTIRHRRTLRCGLGRIGLRIRSLEPKTQDQRIRQRIPRNPRIHPER